MRHAVFIAPFLLLAACGDDAPRPVARSGSAAQASQSAPAGPVTRFDGTWRGSLTTVQLASVPCPQPAAPSYDLEVRNGRGSIALVPRASPFTGIVQSDGAARFSDPLDRANTLSGSFANDRFVGEYRIGNCRYTARFTKL